MITPVSPLLARLIHISRFIGQFIVRLKLMSKMGTVHWIGLKIQCFIQIHCFKIYSVRCKLSATTVAGTFLAITCQLLELERCSNPLQIQQVF